MVQGMVYDDYVHDRAWCVYCSNFIRGQVLIFASCMVSLYATRKIKSHVYIMAICVLVSSGRVT